jgi:hypothetical protein
MALRVPTALRLVRTVGIDGETEGKVRLQVEIEIQSVSHSACECTELTDQRCHRIENCESQHP